MRETLLEMLRTQELILSTEAQRVFYLKSTNYGYPIGHAEKPKGNSLKVIEHSAFEAEKQKVERLEAERDKYKAALEDISSPEKYGMKRTIWSDKAKEALKGGE
jgi:hypothetical protein